MRAFVIVATVLLASTCSASYYGALSSQYHTQDHYGQYSYGYADPNSQKHETRSADGVTHGAYSYVDGHGILQSVSYVADPHNGFRAAGTNLPQGPAPAHPVAVAHSAPWAYAAGPYHVPVITPLGVPADTPEVAAAKAAHFAAHVAAQHGHHLRKRSLWGGHGAWAPAPVIHNGVPVDTPEVQHAKAAHFAAHSKALVETGAYVAPYAGHYNGAPADTPDVAHAKAAHFAAHAAARSGHSGPGYAGWAPAPVIHNGVPVDTPEVQHAKAAHFAAVAKASAHAPSHHGYAPAAGYAHGPYQGPIHIPVIQNGVPVEPAEVQHARASHLAALSGASAGNYNHGYDDGHWNDDGQYHHRDW